MSGRRTLSTVGMLGIAAMLLAIGAVVGVVWESARPDEGGSSAPSTTDVGFAQDMSTHHDQAILMSRTVSRSTSPEIRGLADRIILTQTSESATMRGWLTWFGRSQTAEHPMAWVRADGATHHHGGSDAAAADGPPMPGLASVDEIGRLSEARGRAAEILFLQLLIRHHRGGIEMATLAHNDPTASPATKQLALSMITDQGEEIGQMTLLLKARDADPLPA